MRVMSLVLLGLVLGALLVLVGCERQVAPPLVDVTDVTPREVEAGDRLEIHGTGFPQGRAGRVVFEGVAHRAGEPVVRGIAFEAEGTVVTPDRLELVVRDPLVERLCGSGDHAAHATFEGQVEVSFASVHPGAPPLVGRLKKVSFDALPSSARASVLDARAAEGARVLAFLGVEPGPTTARGIPIEKIRPGSPADRGGLQPGDVIAAADGVHVLGAGDLVPASARALELTVRQSDSGIEDTKTFSLVEYAGERIPTEYVPALVIVGLAMALLVVLLLPGPVALAAIEMRLAARMRTASARGVLRALFGSGKAAAAMAILSAVIVVFALTPYVLTPDIDGVALLASAATLLAWARVNRARGVGASLKALAQTLLVALAVVASVVLAIVHVAALELGEIVRQQGPLPWQWLATRHPAGALLAGLFAASVVALVRSPRSVRSGTSEVLERAGLLLASAMFAAVFLGGWRVGPGLSAAGAALFLAKAWLVDATLLAAARLFASLETRVLPGLAVRRLWPGLLLAGGLVLLSRPLAPSAAIETAFGVTAVTLTALFTVRVVARVRAAAMRPEPHASPFL